MQVTPELFKRYFQGKCTEQETSLVRNWLSEAGFPPDEKLAFEDVNKYLLKEQMLRNIQSRHPYLIREKPVVSLVSLLRIAAAVLVVVGLGFVAYNYFTDITRNANLANVSTDFQRIVTRKGEKAEFVLPDGTKVHLNAGSSLRYSKDFDDSLRIVYLTGEAYLVVAKNPLRPFIVDTEKTRTQVLGTVFSVKAYVEDKEESVAVEEGKVRFSAKSDSGNHVLLTADQLGAWREGKLKKQSVDASKYLAWKDNKLIFDNDRLADIAPAIERWYDVTVKIESKKSARLLFSGRYTNPSLRELLEDMSSVSDFNYKLTDTELIIY